MSRSPPLALFRSVSTDEVDYYARRSPDRRSRRRGAPFPYVFTLHAIVLNYVFAKYSELGGIRNLGCVGYFPLSRRCAI
jgi:hypothetical protein